MPGPARAGVLIYAKDLQRLSAFYQRLLGMRLLRADSEHEVIESADMQLVMHAIPRHIAAGVFISTPPQPREEQAIKPFFTVPSLADAEVLTREMGGLVLPTVYAGPGFRVRNIADPEGNILQVREWLP